MKKALQISLVVSSLCISAANAGIVSYFDSSWTDITRTPSNGPIGVNSGDDLETFSGDFVYPGWGGQSFDAEYIFYKLDGSTLSIGLQTGFDIGDGEQNGYYGGDLALSFNGVTLGDAGSYEYAIDFGNETRDYFDNDKVDAGSGTGIDDAGLYRVTGWNNDIYFDGAGPRGNAASNLKDSSAPFAMDAGTRLLDQGAGLTLLTSSSETTNVSQVSYYRAYEFDLSMLALTDISTLDAHWTMSCGNDAVDGQVALVPEPSMVWLLSSGILGLLASAGVRQRRSRRA